MKSLIVDTLGGFLFLGVFSLTHSITAAILASAALTVGLIAWRLAHREEISGFQWLTLVLVVGLGSVSLATRNPLFVMVKPSLIQAGFGAVMLRPGWLARYIAPARLAQIPAHAVVAAGYVYAVAVFGLAAANLAVALTMGPEAWAAYSAVAPGLVFATLAAGVYLTFRTLVVRGRRAAAA